MKESRYKKINIKDKILKNKKILLIIFLIVIVILLDQTTKNYIVKDIYNSSIEICRGILAFTYIENTGGAYGIGSNNIITFVIVNIIIITLLMKFIVSKKDEISLLTITAISLIIGGGLSNLIDRIFRGCVIDFIDINKLLKYPIFNIADICIVIGCGIIIINLIINTVKCKK